MKYYENLNLENIFYELNGKILEEEWKIIENTKERYLISNLGRVKSVVGRLCDKRGNRFKEKIMKQYYKNKNYYVSISQNFDIKISDCVKILTASHFLNYDVSNSLQKVEHIDGDKKEDNSIYNLHVYVVGTSEMVKLKSKECKLCMEEKMINNFHLNKNTKDGFSSRCKTCIRKKVHTEEYVKNRFIKKLSDIKNNEYELIGDYDLSNKRVKLLHKPCGKVWDTLKNNVFRRDCGYCNTNNKSSLSSKIERFLCSNKMCYESEYTFDNCKDKRKLPFDFAIFDCVELMYLIEADGEQHFKSTGFTKYSLEDRQKKDGIKDKYCKDNNINLIRINYLQEQEVDFILSKLNINSSCECINEVKKDYTKSNTTEEQAEIIRILYLKDGYSVKRIAKEMAISETPITSIIKYKHFPNTRVDLKEQIEQKRKSLQIKNRPFKDLSKEELAEIINLKKSGFSDTDISKLYNVYRKGFRQFIDNWDNIAPIIKYKYSHIETGDMFNTLNEGCKTYNLCYEKEYYKLKTNKEDRKFNKLLR